MKPMSYPEQANLAVGDVVVLAGGPSKQLTVEEILPRERFGPLVIRVSWPLRKGGRGSYTAPAVCFCLV